MLRQLYTVLVLNPNGGCISSRLISTIHHLWNSMSIALHRTVGSQNIILEECIMRGNIESLKSYLNIIKT